MNFKYLILINIVFMVVYSFFFLKSKLINQKQNKNKHF